MVFDKIRIKCYSYYINYVNKTHNIILHKIKQIRMEKNVSNKGYNLREFDRNKVVVVNHIIPEQGYANRSGKKQIPKYIVIHEVSLGLGRSPEKYGMQHYKDKIYKDGIEGSTIGYHYLCGDEVVYQFIPDDEVTCHTGTEGNRESIGLERIICKGTDYSRALFNQAKLAATLMYKWNIPFDRVITHKKMQEEIYPKENPKKCPNRAIAGQFGGVEALKAEIIRCFQNGWFFGELLSEEQRKTLKAKINSMKLQKLSITEEFNYLFDDKIMEEKFRCFFSNEMRNRAEYRKIAQGGDGIIKHFQSI